MAFWDRFRIQTRARGGNTFISDVRYRSGLGALTQKDSMKLSAVYRAVQLISDSVAMLPISLFMDGKRVEDDLSYMVNVEPNNIHTRYQFVKLLVCDMLLQGNAYARIIRDRNSKPIELRYISAYTVRVEYDETNNIKRFYSLDEGVYYDDVDILHFMNHSDNGWYGVSVLKAAENTLLVAKASESAAGNYFVKGGNVSGVLAGKTMLTNDQKEQIRTQWQQVMASENGGIAILGADMSFTPIQMNAADAQLLESRHFNVEEIARFFGLNPTMLGDLTHSSYATFEATAIDFLTNCLQPRLTNIEQELNRKLLLKREKIAGKKHFAFETEDLLRCTKTEMASYYNTMIQNGIMSVNEVRRKMDFEPVDGGDEHYIQLNMATLTAAAKQSNNEEN